MTDHVRRLNNEQAGSLLRSSVSNGLMRINVLFGALPRLAPSSVAAWPSACSSRGSACGFGCLASLPEHATSFTTAELKANLIGSVTEAQSGTTQVWDAEIKSEDSGKTLTLFAARN
jgi:hypothetical protein